MISARRSDNDERSGNRISTFHASALPLSKLVPRWLDLWHTRDLQHLLEAFFSQDGRLSAFDETTFLGHVFFLEGLHRALEQSGSVDYAQRIPVEGRFGTDQEEGAYAPRSCRTPRLELHAIASLIFDAIGNLQITMNKEIEELYELVDNYRTPADTKPTDHTPVESAASEGVDNEQQGSPDPLTAGTEPPHETTIDNSPDRDHRAPTLPRAPP